MGFELGFRGGSWVLIWLVRFRNISWVFSGEFSCLQVLVGSMGVVRLRPFGGSSRRCCLLRVVRRVWFVCFGLSSQAFVGFVLVFNGASIVIWALGIYERISSRVVSFKGLEVSLFCGFVRNGSVVGFLLFVYFMCTMSTLHCF